MIAARRSLPALVSVVVALAWSSLTRAEAPAEVSPAAAPTPTPAPAESSAPPRLRTIHRQVSRRPLAYRSLPVGECLAVQSRSPEFHDLAGQLIRAVAGEQVVDDRAASGRPPRR